MRRSAAPSQLSAKRLKFLSPIQDFNINKESDILNFLEPEIAQSYKLLEFNKIKPELEIAVENVPITSDVAEVKTLRSTSDVLRLISETTIEEYDEFSGVKLENSEEYNASCENKSTVPNRIPVLKTTPKFDIEERTKSNNFASDSEKFVTQYNVLWCKRSGKKHKIWEGDGILTVRNRTAILKNSEGKEIDRGIGYKLKDVSSLEEGSKFCIGGKECEIQSLISSEILSNDEPSKNLETIPSLGNYNKPSFKSIKRPKPCM